jgi:uncharacterized protein YukE
MSKRTTKKRPAANWTRWRETTNQLVDLLDRGLRKLEERTERIEKGDRKPMFESLKALHPVERRVEVLEQADHGSFVAALSKMEERIETIGQELASRIAGVQADFERFRSDARERLERVELIADDAQHRISMQLVELPGRERALLNVIVALANPKESKLP